VPTAKQVGRRVQQHKDRACPHCGRHGAKSAPVSTVTIQCRNCKTTFLNTAQDKLLVGASLLSVLQPAEQGLQYALAGEQAASTVVGSTQSRSNAHVGQEVTVKQLDQQSSGEQEATPESRRSSSVPVEMRDVLAAAEAQSGIPAGCLSADPAWFQRLRTHLHASVFGQDKAIRCASFALFFVL
jgi:ATP-dependent Clp protease ATP-binding subunit ClpA